MGGVILTAQLLSPLFCSECFLMCIHGQKDSHNFGPHSHESVLKLRFHIPLSLLFQSCSSLVPGKPGSHSAQSRSPFALSSGNFPDLKEEIEEVQEIQEITVFFTSF